MLDTQYSIREADMPEDMRFLLNTYPRDTWEAHPGFREKTQHWMAAHQGFRMLAERVRLDTELLLDKDMALDDYAARLSFLGGRLVGNLHGHHGWEDRSYFPELCAADPRFAAGLEVLEQDHADLDVVLDDFTRQANRVIKLAELDEGQARDEAGAVLDQATAIEAFLNRHLGDEEDLAVPIILHHRLRG
ncbi:hemerythrin domain-containing protein [uncultured Tateyamaria sp.]|uniref:hemerythrin domain-containing protein n=1 Tax=uncultured Tateyamaria sp. TaxID=455651 RepID=UPI00260A7993|nr:hemerythrin domain-containing protein [uncultured Tateyamaria sp.]